MDNKSQMTCPPGLCEKTPVFQFRGRKNDKNLR